MEEKSCRGSEKTDCTKKRWYRKCKWHLPPTNIIINKGDKQLEKEMFRDEDPDDDFVQEMLIEIATSKSIATSATLLLVTSF